MSFFFQHNSIRKKFSLVIISACFAAILLVSLLFAGIEYISFRQKAAEELATLSSIFGKYLTEPLLNNQDSYNIDARDILSSLDTNRNVHAAYLFNRENQVVTYYLDSEVISFVQESIEQDFSGKFPVEWQEGEKTFIHFGLKYLSLYSPLYYQNIKIGGLYLLSDLAGIEQRLVGILFVVLLAGGMAVGFAWVLSRWLQKPLSGPILQLAETIGKISESDSYHLRAHKYAEDEIGLLVDGFNNMLAQIQKRDLKIEGHQKYLERMVNDRTAKLTQTINDLQVAREQADSANQAKSVFLANMTHELRTPLVGVLGMNELLMESSLEVQQRSLAESVQRSGRELLDLINDILDFSKIEGGHLRLERAQVDLLKLIQETVQLLAGRAYKKGLELVCYVEPSAAWEVEADGQRLKQILINLLGNAIKFTKHGHVGITLTRNAEGCFVFEVYDTGIGVDSQSQDIIFEAFSQVDESTSRLFGGTGLGLSIVRDLTRMMKGSVLLESQPHRGSKFQVSLPLKPLKSSFNSLSSANTGHTVLLFEPLSPLRDSLTQILSDLGFVAESVSTSDAFINRLESAVKSGSQFDLAILPDGDIKNGSVLLSLAEKSCSKVICLRKISRKCDKTSRLIDISKPFLWDQLLNNDLFEASTIVSSPALVLEPVLTSLHTKCESKAKGKILIVDDNAATRELIGFSLDGSGWLTDNVCSAGEALSAVAREQYQLILMDINMPETDGFEATRIMRKNGVITPIYALTAHGDIHLFEQCKLAGMQGSLRKPFRQKELFALLKKYAISTSEADSATDSGGEGWS